MSSSPDSLVDSVGFSSLTLATIRRNTVPEPSPPRLPAMAAPRRDSRAFTVVVIVLVCLGALPMLLIIALSSAPAIAVLATGLAAIPVIPLVLCYLWLDRYEPEPRRLLLLGLLWGAFAATFGALVVQGIGGLFAGVTDNVGLAVLAPVTEEASKGLFLVLLLIWRRAELDGILDGIVYAGMVGIGFAFTENILYLGASYNGTDGMGPGGLVGVTSTFVVRCLFSPFAHPLFTAFTRHRRRHRGRHPQARRSVAGTGGGLLLRGPCPRHLERLHDLRLRGVRRRLRADHGPGFRGIDLARGLVAALRAEDADGSAR